MSTRDELDKFITPEGRAKVDAFGADCAGESDDVDMDEVVRQNLADHEAALTGTRPAKPATPKAPKPYIGYLVVNAGWAPGPKTRRSWIADVPQMFAHLKDAQAARDGFRAMSPHTSDKVIVEATVTFQVVEGGGDD